MTRAAVEKSCAAFAPGPNVPAVNPSLLPTQFPDRLQKPPTPLPPAGGPGDGGGPKAPDVQKPDTRKLLERMRQVDPNQSQRYRQRTGE